MIQWKCVQSVMEPYVHDGYMLKQYEATLPQGIKRTIYWFTKKEGGKGKRCALPSGYTVVTNDRTGLPMLRKKGMSTWRKRQGKK